MNKIVLIIVASLISYVGSSQITKQMPYIFNNYVEFGDSIKFDNSQYSYGEYLKIDSLSDGTQFIVSDTVAYPNETTSLPYDSITSAPFTSQGGFWRNSDTTRTVLFGGFNDSTEASVYSKLGYSRGVIFLAADIDEVSPSNGEIQITEANTVPTTIGVITAEEQGRYITIVGGSNTNSTEIAGTADIILKGADPAVLSELNSITFIIIQRRSTGALVALELHRNF